MGDIVERELDGTIPVLHAAQRAKLLNRGEVSDIVRKRRHHEYNLLRKNVSRTDYLHYAAFERELHVILKRRAKQRGLEKLQVERTVDKTAARVNLIYSRAVYKFRFDDDLWLHYAKHCIKNGSTRAAARVFAKAIAYRNNSERIWLAAVAFHFDTKGDATGGRTLAQRALRACPKSVKLWKEYFRLELCFLGKLVARRLAIGLRPDADEENGHYSTLNPSENPSSEDNPRQDESSGDKESGYSTSDENDSDIAQKHMTQLKQQSKTTATLGSKQRSESVADPASSLDSEQDPIVSKKDDMDTSELQGPSKMQKMTEPSDEKELDEGDIHEEETSNSSSGAEDSDEESGSSESSSEESVGGSTSSLTFWDGGVPFAVFRNAASRLELSFLDRAEFWDIATSTPFVPPKLLSHMSSFLKERYTKCSVVQAISIREPWDIDRTIRKRSLGNKIGEEDGDIYLSESDEVALANHALKITELLRNAFSSPYSAQLPSPESAGIRSLLQGFSKIVKNTCSSVKCEKAVKELLLLFEERQRKETVDEDADAQEDSTQHDMKLWSISKYESLLQERGNELTASEEFYEALKQKVVVPFRSLEQDRLGCLYLSKERDIGRVRSFTKAILAVPPITMDFLKEAINAELRIFTNSRKEDTTSITQTHQTQIDKGVVCHARKLFKRAISLPAARRDVDLWLSYLDFERSVAGDMKEVSTVSWKATKMLMPSFQESFMELQTLRNLAQ